MLGFGLDSSRVKTRDWSSREMTWASNSGKVSFKAQDIVRENIEVQEVNVASVLRLPSSSNLDLIAWKDSEGD